ncbi:VOC family protein [Solibacillus sp. CAU 1738]|uniref:VOC family protein n=1 Tax=Solibacillus sp. CAU 1738 TaxID=3140363 RepID=UPI003261050B
MIKPLLDGVEAIFIPIKDPHISAKWYEEKLGFTLLYIEENAAVMKINEHSQTVVTLVKTENHLPIIFPGNPFGVGKYFNFLSQNIADTYKNLLENGVKVNEIGGEGDTKFFTFYDPDGNPLGVCQ